MYMSFHQIKIKINISSQRVFLILRIKIIAKDTKVKIHKNIFDNDQQDPRIYDFQRRCKSNSYK